MNRFVKPVSGVFLALAAGSLLLARQAPLGPPGGADETAASIQGYVVRVGGEPLGKARVVLRPVEGRSPVYGAVTEAGGAFHLANIRPGSYRLHIERDGYVDQEYGQVNSSRPGTVLVLLDGQEVRDVLVNMVPTGTIAGRVFDEDGDPIVGARVRAMRYDYDDGERVLNSVRQAETDDLGEYRLYWLEPGEYRVSATFEDRFRAAANLRQAVLAADPGVIERVGERLETFGGRGGAIADALARAAEDPLEEIYVDTYYPGTNDPRASSPIRVAAGSEVRAIDFTVLPTRAVTVRGVVVGPYAPDAGMTPAVDIVPKNSEVASSGNRRGRRFSNGGRGRRDGTFELTGVAPGEYTIVATVRSGGRGGRGGGNQPQLAGFADVYIGAEDVDDLIVRVEPGVPVAGRIHLDESAAEIDPSRLRVRLAPALQLPIGGPNERVEDDGTFLFDSVSPTTYRVSLTGLPEDAFVAAARLGSADVLASGVAVTPDTGLLEFWISGAGSRIDGAVTLEAETAFTGAQVVLVPSDPEREDLYHVASADQYGRFTIRGIAPGAYRVFAWEDAPAGAYRDPEFVSRYDDLGTILEVGQGTLHQVQPRLIRAGQ